MENDEPHIRQAIKRRVINDQSWHVFKEQCGRGRKDEGGVKFTGAWETLRKNKEET